MDDTWLNSNVGAHVEGIGGLLVAGVIGLAFRIGGLLVIGVIGLAFYFRKGPA
jgi:hypothetical protein